MKIYDAPALAAAAVTHAGRPSTTLLHDSTDARVVLFRFDPGQAMPLHAAELLQPSFEPARQPYAELEQRTGFAHPREAALGEITICRLDQGNKGADLLRSQPRVERCAPPTSGRRRSPCSRLENSREKTP